MSTALAGVLEQALKLPEDEQRELVFLLCSNLGSSLPSLEELNAIEAMLTQEIACRSKEIDEGKVQCVPWSEMRAKLERFQGKQL